MKNCYVPTDFFTPIVTIDEKYDFNFDSSVTPVGLGKTIYYHRIAFHL